MLGLSSSQSQSDIYDTLSQRQTHLFLGQKLPRKSFRVPFLRQGSFFKSNERNISEATELCEGSKEGFLRMANITRPFQGVWHVYFTCIHVYFTCIHVYTREIHVLHIWEWSSYVGHPQKPQF